MKSPQSIILILSIALLSACSSNYPQTGPVTDSADFPAVINRAKKDKNDLILYSGKDIYKVLSLQLDKRKKEMTVQLEKLDSVNKVSNTPASVSRMYLFMKDSTSYTLDEPHTLPLFNIQKIETEATTN